jgi:hypothetical protein
MGSSTALLCSVGLLCPTLIAASVATNVLAVSAHREAPPGSRPAPREATSFWNCRPHRSGAATNLELGPSPRSVVAPVTTNHDGVPSAASISLRSYSPGWASRTRLCSVGVPSATLMGSPRPRCYAALAVHSLFSSTFVVTGVTTLRGTASLRHCVSCSVGVPCPTSARGCGLP